MPGAPAGSAFFREANDDTAEGGEMSGYVRMNSVIGKYDFVFTDPVDFDTETHQTPKAISPPRLTIQVGDKAYTQTNPGGGTSGFHLLVLDAYTLGVLNQKVYETNAKNGFENADAVQQLASDLTDAANNPARPLVLLQAFGTPPGRQRW